VLKLGLLGVVAWIASPALAAPSATHNSTRAECAILNQLFIGQADPNGTHPPTFMDRLSPYSSPEFLASSIDRLAAPLAVPLKLSKGLAAHVRASRASPWKPDCAWSTPAPFLSNAFSRPIMSKDGRLAAFLWEQGFEAPDRGRVCLAYKPHDNWHVNCAYSWQR